jgi:hypothetical protein
MIINTYFKPGVWNVHCDVCGFRFKSDQVKRRWDNLMVCDKDWEVDHPQKYLRVRGDRQYVPYVRHVPDDNYVVQQCDYWTKSAIADFGTADCATVGFNDSVQRIIDIYGQEVTSVAAYAIAGYAIAGVPFIL